jgi:hypothetical protein
MTSAGMVIWFFRDTALMCFTVSPSGKAMSGPIVTKSSHSLVVDAERYVPFEPRHEVQKRLRAVLRQELGELVVRDGDVLHARLSGPLPINTDVENALLYNVGGFGDLMSSGVRFELGDEPTAGSVRYRYESADPDAGFAHWERGRTVALVPATRLTATECAPVWWAVAHANLELTDRPAPTEAFAVRLLLQSPGPKLTPERVKGIVDGVVSALQAEEDPAAAQAGALRIAADLRESEEDIASALLDRGRAVLGLVKGLRRPSGWNPSDDRCVAADIRVRPGNAWTVQGDVVTVLPL